MITMRDKIKGALIGGAVGDALGMPVETWTPEKICEVHGGPITGYVPPIEHKWFKPEEMPPGSTTDDTQLTVATMEGLINGHERAVEKKDFSPYMDAIAAAHVEASKHTIGGWGKSTTEAVRRIANGVSWEISGITRTKQRGTGNGICMKCSPLSFWLNSANIGDYLGEDFQFNQRVVDYSVMTHCHELAVHSGLLHTGAMSACFWSTKDDFDIFGFLRFLAHDLWKKEGCQGEEPEDKIFRWELYSFVERNDLVSLRNEMATLQTIYEKQVLPTLTVDHIRAFFGNGSCYVLHSLPFSYAFFLRNPFSLQTILDTVNAGGDTDTNAKMVGEMIGAIQGIQLFERPENRWALEGLKDTDKLLALADRFCDTFGIAE